jgi:two-component system sensor histidine kinase KdpD
VTRGMLRIFLGAAPGVGKTYEMLQFGNHELQRGRDVVIGFLETHGRQATAAQVGALETVPRRRLEHRGATFTEMDVDAVIARAPEVALVDECAHTNVPGSRNAKRWQDIEELRDAGIDVISTVNIQHLESLNDVVEQITGITQRETVPDARVRDADQIDLVDLPPQSIRQRLARGLIYDASKIDAALGNFFRPGNLGALRELALLWLADQVDEALDHYKRDHGIAQTWETRERVLVAMTGAPSGEQVIRRAARIVARAHGELLGVHIVPSDGLRQPSATLLEQHRRLLEGLGGRYREIVGDDPAESLLQVARSEEITQIVVGSTRRTRWRELVFGSVINAVIRGADVANVHVIATDTDADRRADLGRRRAPTLRTRRVWWGVLLGLTGLALTTLLLFTGRSGGVFASAALLYLASVTIASAIGGLRAGVPLAVVATVALNYVFTEPYTTFAIGDRSVVIAVIVFGIVAVTVSWLAEVVARRDAEATTARAESVALARLASTLLDSDEPLQRLVHDLRDQLGLDSAAVLRHDGAAWTVEVAAGEPVPAAPDDATDSVDLGDDVSLVLVGRRMPADDLRLLAAFAAQVAVAVHDRELTHRAADADELAASNELRAALLAAVSHDLRTPLASIKASATSLLQTDVELAADDERQFIEAIVADADNLNQLVGNLLDVSRLQVGAVEVLSTGIGLDEVVPAALRSIAADGARIDIDIDESLPRVHADPALLERVIANLVSNALRWSPSSVPVRMVAGVVPGGVDLRIVDHGPGIPPDAREAVFQPFQHIGDQTSDGVGLGLAVARGFAEVMGGSVELENTPHGGTTAVLSLRAAPSSRDGVDEQEVAGA